MPAGPGGRRDVPRVAAEDLDGIWVATALADAPSLPPTPLAWELVSGDAELVGESLDRRGASVPRRSRRLVAVHGHAYHAFEPFSRAARELLPLDAHGLALAVAAEARAGLARDPKADSDPSLSKLVLLSRRMLQGVGRMEQRVLAHERDASQHYRWLVEMDLGILPDDALGTTIGECVAIQRASRGLEIEATLDLVGGFAALTAFARRARLAAPAEFAALSLVPDALGFSSATPVLSLWSSVAAQEKSVVVRDFAAAFGERGPREREPRSPRWAESPDTVERVVESLARADPRDGEARRTSARQEREALVDDALLRASFVEATTLRLLITSLRQLVALRSRLHLVRARTLSMLRTATLDVDRRLVRLCGSPPDTAFFLSLGELMQSTSRPSAEHVNTALARRSAFLTDSEAAPPPAAIGREVPALTSITPTGGVGLGTGSATGHATLAPDFAAALTLAPGGVLVVRSIDASWAPLFATAGAIVSEAGGVTDEGALVASALGVPVVLGARGAMRGLEPGARLRVDARTGSVSSG